MKIIITEQEAIEAWKTCNGSHGKDTVIEIERKSLGGGGGGTVTRHLTGCVGPT